MTRLILFLTTVLFPISLLSQTNESESTIQIYGIVIDASNKTPLPSATLFFKNRNEYATSDKNGTFRISISSPLSIDTLLVTYVGYTTTRLTVDSIKMLPIEVQMVAEEIEFEQIYVFGNSEPIQNRTELSYIQIPITMVKSLPSFMGQTDVFKSIQAMPGVSSGVEGNTGFYVRGGNLDQTLFLLDGAPVFYPYHSGGFVSLFPAEMIQNIDFYTGAMPAEYGGRLSAITDVVSKASSVEDRSHSLTLGVISAELASQGLLTNSVNYNLVVRKSVLPQVVSTVKALGDGRPLPSNPFSDAFFNVSTQLSSRNWLKISNFLGTDRFEDNNTVRASRGGITTTSSTIDQNKLLNRATSINLIHQGHIVTSQITLYSSTFTSSSVSQISYSVTSDVINDLERSSLSTRNRIDENGIRLKSYAQVNRYVALDAGLSMSYNSFAPKIVQTETNTREGQGKNENRTLSKSQFGEINAFTSVTISPFPWLEIIGGSRITWYGHLDEKKVFIQPRLNSRLNLGKNIALKGGFASMVQPFHFLTTQGFGVNSNIWMGSNTENPPETSQIISAGIVYGGSNLTEYSIEVYDKEMRGVLDYQIGTTFLGIDSNFNEISTSGLGRSRGIEFLIMRKRGRMSGWISYTLSKTTRSFSDINEGQEFNFIYDRPHVFNANAQLNITKNIDASLVFTFQSGHNVTFPTSRISGSVDNPLTIGPQWELFLIEQRNNFRLPEYHRLDISFSYKLKTSIYDARFNVGIYNLYNRQNPVGARYSFARTENANIYKVVTEYDLLFPIIPFVSLNIKI